MADAKFLTPEEVSARYRGEVTVGTLRTGVRCESDPHMSRSAKPSYIRWTNLSHGIEGILWFVARRKDWT
ncbi:hypothetical protein SAMN05216338_1001349 [Bradyrhizobium sp. Rc2d]|nr:hypothetical protein SAMN05216338_1001349 [Bradyrhizobium sp. Rc2d]